MKIIFILIALLLAVVVLADVNLDSSCSDDCDDIDRAWNELRTYLGITPLDGGLFFNPALKRWASESVYLSRPETVASTLVQGPKCSAAGGKCIDVSTTSCGGLPLPTANDDCPTGLTCCPIVQTHHVSMTGSKFVPDTLTIEVGDTVTWTNKDAKEHTVTADSWNLPSGAEPSQTLVKDGSFSFKFDAAGTYVYYSNDAADQSARMTGTIFAR